MRRILALVLSCLSVTLLAQAPKDDFLDKVAAAFETGDLRVEFTSRGCFHWMRFELLFQREGEALAKVSVTELVRIETTGKGAKPEFRRQPAGFVMLGGRDMERLGQLLEYYSKVGDGGCTTVDHLVFAEVRGGNTTVLADFEDGTCGTHDRLDVLTFLEIVRRVQQDAAVVKGPN